jgi:hypothetical protein
MAGCPFSMIPTEIKAPPMVPLWRHFAFPVIPKASALSNALTSSTMAAYGSRGSWVSCRFTSNSHIFLNAVDTPYVTHLYSSGNTFQPFRLN